MKSEEELRRKKELIFQLDFSKLRQKLTDHQFPNLYSLYWDEESVDKGIDEYRKYLFIRLKYRVEYPRLAPTLRIDEIWHGHVLNTEQYHRDCEKIFGEYLHHYPYTHIDEEGKLYFDHGFAKEHFLTLTSLYYAEFKEVLETQKPGNGYSKIRKNHESEVPLAEL